MDFEDMVIAHGLLTNLGEENIDHLLDLMEDPSRPTPSTVFTALAHFLRELEADFGAEHPVVLRVREALALPPRTMYGGGVLKNHGMRIS